MKKGQKLWTREELILAINLYCKLPFGKMHKSNPEVIDLANLIGRTPSSVGLKLGNFASQDPSLKARGIKGADHTSRLDKKIWDEFYHNWDDAAFESELLLEKWSKKSAIEKYQNLDPLMEGKKKERLVRSRINQNFFRKVILASYNDTCCITGISQPELLIAGHIIPWSKDEQNRMNPSNGLAMNGLHDKAFELGLISISPDYKILISSELKQSKTESARNYFQAYEGREIILPSKFLPDPEFLANHNTTRFRR
ncbi:HNH endonuclease [Marinoscillum sp. MHG1-6]|uniref:HNH endonuclease n=1 Tax=Marinoscillum sp. MHG1-6 TaxID=2959627 RepID=UPI0021575A63|nr:HNH endonuclease [Marinoscillum sp. MHG1-6]